MPQWREGIFLALACAGVLGAQTAPAAKPVAPNTVVLRVGNATVTAREFDALIAGLPAQEQAEAAAHKREVADQYAQILAMDQEAVRLHLDQDPAYQAEMRMARERALAAALIAHLRESAAPSPAAVQAYYQAHQQDFEQARVRHILVVDSATPGAHSHRTKAAALAKIQAIAARLKRGESFATVARAESDDPGSKAKGGELGFLSHGQTVPQFDRVVWTLKPGVVSAPFETPFGYHIVEVEERRTLPLDQVRTQIADQLLSTAVRQKVQSLAAAAPPQLDPAYFGPPAAAPAGPKP